MKIRGIKVVSVLLILCGVVKAGAWYTLGIVQCDANLNDAIDAADQPVQSAMVVVTNLSGTFSNIAWTEASGFYIAELPPVADTYATYVHPLTVPNGTTQVSPPSASFQLSIEVTGATNNFLIRNPACVVQPQNVHYVDASNTTPVPPYTSWPTAATNIQDAIDVAAPGALVLVTNGVYAFGGKVTAGQLFNRVAITKPLTVRSVNGPEATAILGLKGEPGPVRCAYLTNAAVLAGFTLTNGGTIQLFAELMDQNGAGAWCESTNAVITNCIITSCLAFGFGGGSYSGTLTGCIIRNNEAIVRGGGVYEAVVSASLLVSNHSETGGGAFGGQLAFCTLMTNGVAGRNGYGGGAANSLLARCDLIGNTSGTQLGGGGAGNCVLNHCTLIGNRATTLNSGGGAASSTLNWCVLVGNSAYAGGGVSGGTLEDCLLVTNSATLGGGAASTALTNCTVAFNSATDAGGGVWDGSVYNSIVYYNSALTAPNIFDGTVEYTCTIPLPGSGTGNITNAPMFVNPAAGNFRLQAGSPCIDAGNDGYVHLATDLDGRPRVVGGIVDMGAYEDQGADLGGFIGWLEQCGLDLDGSADHADTDGDHANNYDEWVAGTDPVDAASVLKLLGAEWQESGLVVTWASVTNRSYAIERSSPMAAPPAFVVIQGGIGGQAGTTSYVDTEPNLSGSSYYRVKVEN